MMNGGRLVAKGLLFPEGPRWRDGRLWFSDFLDCRIATLAPVTGEVETVLTLNDSPSGLGSRPDGTLLFVEMGRRRLSALTSRGAEVVAELGHLCGGRANDMAVDGQGGAYVGNFGFDMLRGAKPQTTSLIYVSPAGEARAVADDLLFPNGVTFLDGGRTLAVAETYANRVTAFDVGDDGALFGRRTFAQFGPDVAPDGICADASGAVWVATARDGRCLLVSDGGKVLTEVTVPTGIAYACARGENGRDLFVCSAPGFRPDPGQREGCIWLFEV